MRSRISRASASRRSVIASMVYEPATGSTVLATPVSAAITCCVRRAILRRLFGGQRQRFVTSVAVQRLRPSKHSRHRLQRHADDVVVGLLGGQRAAGRLGMEPQLLRTRVGRAEAVAHDVRPQPPRRAELGDLLEKVVVAVEEERKALSQTVDVEPGVDGGLHVGDGVGKREGDLLRGCRPGFADVVPADRDRVPLRQFTLAEREDVGDDPQRRGWRVDVGPAREVLLQDVVLDRAAQRRQRDGLAPRDRCVERQQDDRRRVDGHRRRHAVERNAVEQFRHVLDRVDGHADAADLASCQRVVGVVTHLRRQIEGDAQAVDPLRQQVSIALVGLGCRRKPGVLPHGPQPAAIHRRLDAAGEGECAGLAQGGVRRPVRQVVRRIERPVASHERILQAPTERAGALSRTGPSSWQVPGTVKGLVAA